MFAWADAANPQTVRCSPPLTTSHEFLAVYFFRSSSPIFLPLFTPHPLSLLLCWFAFCSPLFAFCSLRARVVMFWLPQLWTPCGPLCGQPETKGPTIATMAPAFGCPAGEVALLRCRGQRPARVEAWLRRQPQRPLRGDAQQPHGAPSGFHQRLGTGFLCEVGVGQN